MSSALEDTMKLASRIPCYLCGKDATHSREWPVVGLRFICQEHDPVPHEPCDYIVQPVDLRPYYGAGLVGTIMLAPSFVQAFQILQAQGAADAAFIFVGCILVLLAFTLLCGSIAAGNPRRP